MKEFPSAMRNARKQGAIQQAANGLFKPWETRTELARSEAAAASAASDANTARLRALRLEKERQDADAAALMALMPATPATKKPVRRVIG
jgi:hypothetical protein